MPPHACGDWSVLRDGLEELEGGSEVPKEQRVGTELVSGSGSDYEGV